MGHQQHFIWHTGHQRHFHWHLGNHRHSNCTWVNNDILPGNWATNDNQSGTWLIQTIASGIPANDNNSFIFTSRITIHCKLSIAHQCYSCIGHTVWRMWPSHPIQPFLSHLGLRKTNSNKHRSIQGLHRTFTIMDRNLSHGQPGSQACMDRNLGSDTSVYGNSTEPSFFFKATWGFKNTNFHTCGGHGGQSNHDNFNWAQLPSAVPSHLRHL